MYENVAAHAWSPPNFPHSETTAKLLRSVPAYHGDINPREPPRSACDETLSKEPDSKTDADERHRYQGQDLPSTAVGQRTLFFYEFATRKTFPLATLDKIASYPAVAPDGKSIVFSQVDQADQTIMIVNHFR